MWTLIYRETIFNRWHYRAIFLPSGGLLICIAIFFFIREHCLAIRLPVLRSPQVTIWSFKVWFSRNVGGLDVTAVIWMLIYSCIMVLWNRPKAALQDKFSIVSTCLICKEIDKYLLVKERYSETCSYASHHSLTTLWC